MIKRKLKLPSYIRWIGWVLLVQFVLVNISAALYAYKLTHFYTDPSVQNYQPAKNIFTKTWRLFTGPRFPKSVITTTPVFRYDTIPLTTAKGITIDSWYGRTDSVAKGSVILFHGITTMFRLGDASLLDLDAQRIVGIGELKTTRIDSKHLNLHFVASFGANAVMPEASPLLRERTKGEFASVPALDSKRQARLDRQIGRASCRERV